MTGSPVGRAVGAAGTVVVVAIALYAVAAVFDRWPQLVVGCWGASLGAGLAFDRWPQLVVGCWGASLGAGLAINRITYRELDWPGDLSQAAGLDRTTALQHQISLVFVAITAGQTAAVEHFGWAAATILCAVAWAWTLTKIAAGLEQASRADALHAYFRAFQVVAVVLAVSVIYASVAIESPWLWRPATPADLQWLVWFAILEFASLPVTFVVLRY